MRFWININQFDIRVLLRDMDSLWARVGTFLSTIFTPTFQVLFYYYCDNFGQALKSNWAGFVMHNLATQLEMLKAH